MRIVDLFCGIGSFHQAARELGAEVVLACDIDPNVRRVYEANYGLAPHGDIAELESLPDHEVLCFGSPCQPFSRIGQHEGLAAAQSVLEHVLRLISAARPKCAVMENVPDFEAHGLPWLRPRLEALGYRVRSRVLNCWEQGIPQNRRRLFVVALPDDAAFAWPEPVETPELGEYLELELVRTRALTVRCGGRGSPAGSRHCWDAYETRDGGTMRLTAAQAQRLQGFGPEFEWAGVSSSAKWRMLGNTIPTCLSRGVLGAVKKSLM